jgi:hypothetical protein
MKLKRQLLLNNTRTRLNIGTGNRSLEDHRLELQTRHDFNTEIKLMIGTQKMGLLIR